MSLPIIIKPEAEADLYMARTWYDKQLSGLGNHFLDEISSAFEEIQKWPLLSPIIINEVRLKLLKRFPYLLLYRVDESQLTIIAVYHTSRSPESWQSR